MGLFPMNVGGGGGTKSYGITNMQKGNTPYSIKLDVGDLLVLELSGNSTSVSINNILPYPSNYNNIPGLTFLPATDTSTTYTSAFMGWTCNTAGDFVIKCANNGDSRYPSFFAPIQS